MNKHEPCEDLARVLARRREWMDDKGNITRPIVLEKILRQYGWTHTTNDGYPNE